MKLLLVFFLTSILYFSSVGQTGPGGVGNTSSNLIWLEADEISSLIDGDSVSTWADESGNANDLTQNNLSFQPQYKTNIINGLPVVRFYQTNGRLRRNPFTSPTTAVSAIYVNSTTESNDGIISYTSSTDNDFLIFNSDNISIYRGSNTNSGVSSNDGSFHIINVGWRSSDGSTELWKDGNRSYTTTHRTGTSITSGGSIAIAGEQDIPDGNYESTQDHLGDFAEVILFNTYLNRAQHIIIANYLAAKYNLAITNDYYSYSSLFPNDVAGIGRENATNIHSSAMSDNILRIQNASGLNVNQEYLLFGHDDGDATNSWTTTEAPNSGTNIRRLAREWRLDETGDVGDIDFVVDVNNMPALPAGFNMYALLVDNDGDFSNGASVYEMTLISGTEYGVNGVAITDGDYVSIAAVEPIIEHTLASSSGFEPFNATIEISLNFISQTDRTVSYNTADGTALSSQPDYSAVVGGSATILAGNQNTSYTVNITNDVTVEASENFTVTLSSPPTGVSLGSNTVHSYSINDDDDTRKIYFSLNSSSGLESVSSPTITVEINNTDAVNVTTTDYNVTGGTATGGGTDYSLASGTATINAGTSTTQITLNITDDLIFETNETVIVELSNPSNCNLDGTLPFGGTGFLEHTYTITNNDTPPEIEFDVSSSSGAESLSPVNLLLNLNSISEVDASVSYTVSGTASGSGVDYTLANGTATINQGDLSNSISVIVVDDAIEEPIETIIVTINTPVNAILGTNTIHTYSIIDNDNFGHLGPGGVGNSSNNILWVRSGDLSVVANGTDVTSWDDISGNNHDLSQSNTAFAPRYYGNVVNSLPVVRFDRANGRIIRNSFTNFPTTEITTIFVNSNTDSGDGVVSYANSSSSNEYLLFNSSNLTIFRGGTNNGTGTSINGGVFRIITNTWQSSNGRALLYRNGTQNYSGTLALGSPIIAGGCLAIAGEQDAIDGGYAASQSHQGDFAEIIIYDQVLNSAKRKIVENYLASKYNLSIANDFFSYDFPGNYELEVAGIGRDDASNLHQDAQGTAILRINNPSNLDDGDYLIWGHDDADSNSNTTDVPPTVDNRFDQVWRIQETGNVGTVSVNFDLSDFTIGSSSDLVLLIDTDDGSFVNSSITSLSSFVGNIATFDAINFSSGNWFTIASLSAANPLPIELLEFSVKQIDDLVELNWTTQAEINNDYFTIERSSDLESWQAIATIDGAGNSNRLLNYSAIDPDPILGVSFYRLKQTDFDGESSYSKAELVNFNNQTQTKLHFYPNPVSTQLTVEGENEELERFKIYSISGKDLTFKVNKIEGEGNRMVLDVSNLLSGSYFLRTLDKASIFIKK